MMAGGFAGVVCWVVSYPQDVVKSRLQVAPDTIPPRYKASPFWKDGGFIGIT
jgi:solute carrier family 25 carnitine/acylcarnitine transporter 20/29